ncbi:MAG: cation:proton antiporter [Bryobacterales bacterium]
MDDLSLIRSLGIMIVAAAAVVLLLRRIYTPTIVSYIVVGLILGPLTNLLAVFEGQQGEAESLEIISEIGIALLLFLVGLELSLERIRDVGRVSLYAGIGQVVFTAAGGFALAMVLHFNVTESIFLATALTFSSTVVVVKLLDQKREIHSLYGRIAVGIFLVQDLVVIVALTFLAGLSSPQQLEPNAVAASLGKAFLGMAGLLAAAMAASRYILPRPFAWAARSPQTLFVWSLCWCFLLVVAAERMELSKEIGAFLAGVSLAQLGCSGDLRRRVHPLMNFFIAVFFISLGAQMELASAGEHWQAGLVLSLFVIIGNPIIFMWIIVKNGYNEKVSFLTSVTVAQISEFSFIFAAMGRETGLIDASIVSLTTVVGLVTIAVSAYMILYNHELYEWFRGGRILRVFGADTSDVEEPQEPALRDHIVVVGMNSLGRQLVSELSKRGETVLAIDTDSRKLQGLPVLTINGNVDHMEVIEQSGMAHAKLVVSALQIEDANLLLAYRCKQLGVPVAVHGFDRSVIDNLRREGVDYVIDSRARGIGAIMQELAQTGAIGQ